MKVNNSIIFLILAIISCGAAIGMLITRNLLHAALLMFVVMFGLAGLFVLAKADVLAVSHLLIYVGGVMILILFGIMLTQNRSEDQKNEMKVQENDKWFPLLISIAGFYGWIRLIEISNLPTNILPGDESKVRQVGFLLTTNYSFIFELVGIFLLIALIGATYIAKKDE
jgi:NADH-quinone oxidoreductase subunit J